MSLTINIPAYPPRSWTDELPGAEPGRVFFHLGRAALFDVWSNERLQLVRTSVQMRVPLGSEPKDQPKTFYTADQVAVVLAVESEASEPLFEVFQQQVQSADGVVALRTAWLSNFYRHLFVACAEDGVYMDVSGVQEKKYEDMFVVAGPQWEATATLRVRSWKAGCGPGRSLDRWRDGLPLRLSVQLRFTGLSVEGAQAPDWRRRIMSAASMAELPTVDGVEPVIEVSWRNRMLRVIKVHGEAELAKASLVFQRGEWPQQDGAE